MKICGPHVKTKEICIRNRFSGNILLRAFKYGGGWERTSSNTQCQMINKSSQWYLSCMAVNGYVVIEFKLNYNITNI